MNKNKAMNLVNAICNEKSTGCRSLNKTDIARELLSLASVPQNAEIQEIPLDWNNQVEILFLLPNDNSYYSLFAGLGTDGNFYFELSIVGTLHNGYFNFFDAAKFLDIDYFLK